MLPFFESLPLFSTEQLFTLNSARDWILFHSFPDILN